MNQHFLRYHTIHKFKEEIPDIEEFRRNGMIEVEKSIEHSSDSTADKNILRFWENDTFWFSMGAINIELDSELITIKKSNQGDKIQLFKERTEQKIRVPNRYFEISISALQVDRENQNVKLNDALFVRKEVLNHLESKNRDEFLEIKDSDRVLRELQVKQIVRNVLMIFCDAFDVSNIEFVVEHQSVHFVDTRGSTVNAKMVKALGELFNIQPEEILNRIESKIKVGNTM